MGVNVYGWVDGLHLALQPEGMSAYECMNGRCHVTHLGFFPTTLGRGKQRKPKQSRQKRAKTDKGNKKGT